MKLQFSVNNFASTWRLPDKCARFSIHLRPFSCFDMLGDFQYQIFFISLCMERIVCPKAATEIVICNDCEGGLASNTVYFKLCKIFSISDRLLTRLKDYDLRPFYE